MEKKKVEDFMMMNKKYFPEDKIHYIEEKLLDMDETEFQRIAYLEFKDPSTMMLISIFAGGIALDRFMLKDTGMAVLKLLTGGGCMILFLYDIFTMQKQTKEYNYRQLHIGM